ncbi:MAG: PEP-CTERM sorting domain-containing protein [Chitinivibrionales bacterium]|nr:PEP-CTERM sorting domain-containing protein [Chitinivibrionales bacterium]
MISKAVHVLLALAMAGSAGPISIRSGSMMNFVDDDFNSVSDIVEYTAPSAEAFSDELISIDGGLFAVTEISFAESEYTNELTIDFSHDVESDVFGAYASDFGSIIFRPSTDVAYSITGSYYLYGEGLAEYFVSLYQGNNGIPLFKNDQYSENAFNESFVAGGQGGNTSNELSGAASGVLSAGRNYSLNYYVVTSELEDIQEPQRSTGNLTLSFHALDESGNPVPVPEPSTITLLASGLLALFCAGFLRKSGN